MPHFREKMGLKSNHIR